MAYELPTGTATTNTPAKTLGGSSALHTSDFLSGGGKIAGLLAEAEEFSNQIIAQESVLSNTSQMVKASLDAQLFDLDRRTAVIKGSVIARSGKAGVTADSQSITNQAADVAASAAVDRMRLQLSASNQLNLLAFQRNELSRQVKVKKESAFIGAGLQVVGMGAGFMMGGPAGAAAGSTLATAATTATTK